MIATLIGMDRPDGKNQTNIALGVLVALALARLLLETWANNQYGFHRDELATLDDARRLAWGYVAYPPLTPFVGRMGLEIFGLSLRGIRFFAAFAQAIAMVLTGLMARELGGKGWAQVIAGAAAGIGGVAVAAGVLFQYVSFDYLWWVAAAYFVIRLLKSEDPRWWLAIGMVVGLGLMTKYTVAFFVAGLAGGILLTDARRYLLNRWLWLGVAVALLIFLPNLIWQVRHDFVSLEFLRSIHARDVRIGRTSGFLPEQLFVPANPVTIPLWIAGLFFYFRSTDGKRYRALGWTFVFTVLLFLIAKGRSYYTGPLYPMLLAAGAVRWERALQARSRAVARLERGLTYAALAIGATISFAFVIPLAPVNSPWWNAATHISDDWREEIGWPELIETTANVWNALPPADRAHAAILAGNYGEAGAIDLFGAPRGLPQVISGINSYWARGFGDTTPETIIVIGFSRRFVERSFESCEVAAHTWNRYGIMNEETRAHPEIFVCRRLRQPWSEFWKSIRYFG